MIRTHILKSLILANLFLIFILPLYNCNNYQDELVEFDNLSDSLVFITNKNETIVYITNWFGLDTPKVEYYIDEKLSDTVKMNFDLKGRKYEHNDLPPNKAFYWQNDTLVVSFNFNDRSNDSLSAGGRVLYKVAYTPAPSHVDVKNVEVYHSKTRRIKILCGWPL